MRTRFLGNIAIVGLLGIALASLASGQVQPNADKLSNLKTILAQAKSNFSQLSSNHRLLAGSQARLMQAAHMVDRLAVASAAGRTISGKGWSHGNDAAGPGVVSVNDNSTDLIFSSYDGVTQSTSSTAMCGNQVVVGFNDTGSVLQTVVLGTGNVSMAGVAVSSDGGRTFRDLGFINPSDFIGTLNGDPSVTCSDSNTFFYVQTSSGGLFPNLFTAIAISKSTDGGNTWGDPQLVARKINVCTNPICAGPSSTLEKPSTAIDPSNPLRMYVTYTDLDDSQTSATCGNQVRTAIELVMSTDGGQSFGNPIVIDEVCGRHRAVAASHVAFNSHGVAYVAWERISLSGFERGTGGGDVFIPFPSGSSEVRVTNVTPNGTVAPSIVVDQKVFGGGTFAILHTLVTGSLDLETDLQGQFHDLAGLDLAVDHSGGPNDGTVYVTWDDGRNKSVPDLAAFKLDVISNTTNSPIAILGALFPTGVQLPNGMDTAALFTNGNYQYTDVLVSKSRDGVHFGPTMQVNSDQQPTFGGGHDHFMPGIATDRMGRVAICWYDRRNDPLNFNIERFCARSENGGRQWSNFKVPISPFAPIHRLDFGQFFDANTGRVVDQSYMGEYDGLTTDFTGQFPGFIGAFQWMSSGMNPDVKSYKFN